MDILSMIEDWLAHVYRGAPRLNSESKKSIIEIWPWVALIFGILQIWAAIELWRVAHDTLRVVKIFNNYYGTSTGSSVNLNVFYWFSLFVLLVDAVILLMAFPRLRNRSRQGWKLLFYGSILNLLYGVFSAFNGYGRVASLFIQIIVSAVVFYFLFQIRDSYHKAK